MVGRPEPKVATFRGRLAVVTSVGSVAPRSQLPYPITALVAVGTRSRSSREELAFPGQWGRPGSTDVYARAAVRRRLPFTQRAPMIAAAPAGSRRSGKPSGVLALTMLKHAGPVWSALLIACVALWSSE
jgi:hypothetical protein